NNPDLGTKRIMLVFGAFISILIVVLTPLLTWIFNYSKYLCLRNVPGPTTYPIIGNALEMENTTVGLLNSFMRLQKKYGSFYKLWLGPRLNLMVSKPEYLEQLLNSNVHLSKSVGYDLFKPWLGDGLLVSTGAKWRSRRKMITTDFHFKILEEFTKVFNKQFDILVDILTQEVEAKPDSSLEIHNFVNLASLDTICETAFGTPIKAQFKGNVAYVEAVTGFLEIFTIRFFSSWLRNPIFFRCSPHYNKYVNYLNILHDFTKNVIRERKKEFKSKASDNSNNEGVKIKAALLDMLLEASHNGNDLTDEDIREEVDTFMFEGHDTASVAICYALYAICQNGNIQKKVYSELEEVFGNDSKVEITTSQINELKYLDIVVKEALRYYPPVPLIERMLEDDWTVDGVTIPKGTTISIFLYGMNHADQVFSEPERFDPERFLPEKQSSRHNYAFIPFSAGPRNCIGKR
ncbi:hypothetical protein NQ315_004144, partial [Exocentrus adspersus]